MKHKLLTILVSVMLMSVAFSGVGFAQTESPTDVPDTPTDSTVEANQSETNNTSTSVNETEDVAENESEPSPGLQMAAVMGGLTKDIDASIERYTLGYKVSNAESQEEKEQIINDFVDKQKAKSEQASSKKNEAVRQKGAGAKYQSAMSIIESRNAAESGEYAKTVAEENNVSVNQSKVEFLSNNAKNMSGQEVSKVARSLAGPPEKAGGKPPWAGDEDDVEVNETVASEKLAEAEASLAEARNNSNISTDTIEEAESDLAEARSLFDKAQNLSTEEVENESEVEVENESESELAEERQDLYEEVYDLASDTIEELEDDSKDAESDEEKVEKPERPDNAEKPERGDDKVMEEKNLSVGSVSKVVSEANDSVSAVEKDNNSSIDKETLTESRELVSDAQEALSNAKSMNISEEEKQELLEDAKEDAEEAIVLVEEDESEETDSEDKDSEDKENEDDEDSSPFSG